VTGKEFGGGFVVQMILAEKAEALREEADSLSTAPADNNSHATS